MVTDGQYNPTVPWLAEQVKFEDPQTRDDAPARRRHLPRRLAVRRRGDQVPDRLDPRAEEQCLDRWPGWRRSTSVEVVDDAHPALEVQDGLGRLQRRHRQRAGLCRCRPKALQADAEKYDSQPQGTGPYILEEASPGNFLKLKRNPNWWFAKASGNPDMPYFDGIHVSVIPDPAVRLANLRAGKIDALTLDKSQYAACEERPEPQRLPLSAGNHLAGVALQHHQGRVPGHPPAQGGEPRDRSQGADRRHAVRPRPHRELHVSGRPLVPQSRAQAGRLRSGRCRRSCWPRPATPTA